MEDANNKRIEATNSSTSIEDNMLQWLFHEDSSDALVDTTTTAAVVPCSEPQVDRINHQELMISRATNEPCVGEDLIPEFERDFWAPIEGFEWDWIDPSSFETCNDIEEDDRPIEETTSHVTFQPFVTSSRGNQVTLEELHDDYHGDIRSPSDITDVESLHSHLSSEPACIHGTASPISSEDFVDSCASFREKASSIDSLFGSSDKKPDLMALMNDMMAKIKELTKDINALVSEFGRLMLISTEEPPCPDCKMQDVNQFVSSQYADSNINILSDVSSVDNNAKEAKEDKCCNHDDDDFNGSDDEC